jgi:short-subunit dehydrogenase
MPETAKPLAIVTGASVGIGYELAKLCAQNGYDLLIAADQAAIHDAAKEFQALGASVDAVEADWQRLRASTGFMLRSKGGRWALFWPMRGMGWDMPFSIRISRRFAT